MQERNKTVNMMIKMKNSTMVRPANETPKKSLWVSNMDLIMPKIHTPVIYFYRRPNGSPDFFDPGRVKEALSRALVPFYPVAGRVRENVGQRIEIDCNGEGVLFVEAETTSVIDDLGDFTGALKLKSLIPTVDYSAGISSYPLCVFQLTYFKCGGVSLVVGFHQLIVDASSRIQFINTWANMARGLDTISPFMDRTLLVSRNPPQPKFPHNEYKPKPQLIALDSTCSSNLEDIEVGIFKITPNLMNALKAKSKDEDWNDSNYSTYEVLSSHIWRCVCKARGLADAQATKLFIPVNVRSRLQQAVPPEYFGNAILVTTPMEKVGDLVSKPICYAASKIHEALAMVDNTYLSSAIDYLELQADLDVLAHGPHNFRSPNLGITSWIHLPIYNSDFGWGPPIFMGPTGILDEGMAYMLPNLLNDGSSSLVIILQAKHLKLFKTYIYDIDIFERH